MPLAKANRYWHTLRYLKPVQFYGRLWFRFYKPKPDLSPAPVRRAVGAGWELPAAREPSLVGPEQFLFLNERGDLGRIGWDGEERSKLWRYNQHYFDDLNAMKSGKRLEWHRELMQRWVEDNPPGRCSGWEPYPTSLRIVNWVKWALAGNTLSEACLQSLAVQARWLAKRLEIHLLGNHLFANAKALVFAGSLFAGPEAERWLKTGFLILAREVPEQILPDGGHFERSTMYHGLALEDMLDLINVLRCLDQAGGPMDTALRQRSNQFLQSWPEIIGKMFDWLNAMRHPDGEISFFNDAALGIAPSCDQLIAYGEQLGLGPCSADLGSVHLSTTGYVRLTNADACVLLDAAPVGPDYLPGHAHADTLSLEASLHGQRIFVNSGTSEYGAGRERLRQRGTAAHSTVEVAGKDSSEVWGGFRVARRARPYGVKVSIDCTDPQASGWHDGYRRLSEAVDVGRSVRLGAGSLVVEDVVCGKTDSAVARFYCHPAVQVEVADGAVLLNLSGGQIARMAFDGARSVSVEDTTWHPRFGVVERNRCITVRIKDERLISRLQWRQD